MLKSIKKTWWVIWTAAYLEVYSDGELSRKDAIKAAIALHPFLSSCRPKVAALVEVDALLYRIPYSCKQEY